MRLIEELLKDDFFRGGFKAQAAKPKFKVKTGDEGRPMGLIIAAAVVVLLAGAGSGWYFFAGGSEMLGSQGATPKNSKVAAVIPPPMPSPASAPSAFTGAVTGATAVTAATAATATTSATQVTDVASAPENMPEEAEVAAQTGEPAAKAAVAAAPQPKPAAAAPPPSRYRIGLPALADRAAVDGVLKELRRLGIQATAVETQMDRSIYRVLASRNATAEEANTIKIKADVFGLKYTARTNEDGSVFFDFGTFDSPNEARKVAAEATKFGIQVRAGRQVVKTKGFQVRAATMPRQTAEKAVAALANKGIKADLNEVNP